MNVYELIFLVGIILVCISALSAIISAAVFSFLKRRLKRELTKDYGEEKVH